MPVPRSHPPRPPRRLPLALAAVALSVGVLTGCWRGRRSAGTARPRRGSVVQRGGVRPGCAGLGDSTESQALTATAADFEFSLDREDLAAGSYEIELVNDGAASHDLDVEQDGDEIGGSDVIPPGESTTSRSTSSPASTSSTARSATTAPWAWR